MVDFCSDLNLFNLDQFAYLRGKSKLAQLLTCYNDCAKARNRSQQTDIIFLDLSKAFDSVPHKRLLLKLQRRGIDGSLLLWIRNFLTKAACRVKEQLFRLVTRDFRRAPRDNTRPNLMYHSYK